MGYTSPEVKYRYNKKAYRQYMIRLRYDRDMDLIKRLEAEKDGGGSINKLIINALRKSI